MKALKIQSISIVIITLLLIGTGIFPSINSQRDNYEAQMVSSGDTIYVDGNGNGDYITIQEALDASKDGDTIFVYDGIYRENLVIDTNIALIGESKEEAIIQMVNGNVCPGILCHKTFTIEHIAIRGNEDFIKYSCGIRSGENKCVINDTIISDCGTAIGIWGPTLISNNTFINCWYGVFICRNNGDILVDKNIFLNSSLKIWDPENCFITNNKFFSSGIGFEPQSVYEFNLFFENNSVNNKPLMYLYQESDKTITSEAGQIILLKCENITIKNQDLSSSVASIFLLCCKNCEVNENKIYTSDVGIHVSGCSNISVKENTIELLQEYNAEIYRPIYIAGIYILDSYSITIENNSISDANLNENGNGIDIDDSSDILIFHNKLSNIYHAIHLESIDIIIEQNTFYQNHFGIFCLIGNDLIAGSFGHIGNYLIQENNFIGNENHIYFCIINGFDFFLQEPPAKILLNRIQKNQKSNDSNLDLIYNGFNKNTLKSKQVKRTTIINNYYDNHLSKIPKIILGNNYIMVYPFFVLLPWIKVDWSPSAKQIEW